MKFAFAVYISVIFLELLAAQLHFNRRVSMKTTIIIRRTRIIKCCGKKHCQAKKHPPGKVATTIIPITTTNVQQFQKEMETTEFYDESSTEIITATETLETDTTVLIPVAPVKVTTTVRPSTITTGTTTTLQTSTTSLTRTIQTTTTPLTTKILTTTTTPTSTIRTTTTPLTTKILTTTTTPTSTIRTTTTSQTSTILTTTTPPTSTILTTTTTPTSTIQTSTTPLAGITETTTASTTTVLTTTTISSTSTTVEPTTSTDTTTMTETSTTTVPETTSTSTSVTISSETTTLVSSTDTTTMTSSLSTTTGPETTTASTVVTIPDTTTLGSSTETTTMTSTTSTPETTSTGTTDSTTTPPATTCRSTYCDSLPCVPDPLKFNLDGSLKAFPLRVGTVWPSVCGKKYILGKVLMTYLEATQFCCSFGYRSASFENVSEHACVANYNINTAKVADTIWTSGTDIGCGYFNWCTAVEMMVADNPWMPGQPNRLTGHHCIQMELWYTGPVSEHYYNDFLCDTKYRAFCEEEPAFTTTTITPG